MSFRSVFDSLKPRSSRTPARPARRSSHRQRPASRKLHLEALEDRCLLSFNPVVNYPVGGSPLDVAAGDFNGDGQTDLATINATELSLLTGVTASGFYVRTAKSPAISDLTGMLQNWPR